MKAGDLIRFRDPDHFDCPDEEKETHIGIIIRNPMFHESYKKIAVEVYWQDDCSYTWEVVEIILSPDRKCGYLELISENR